MTIGQQYVVGKQVTIRVEICFASWKSPPDKEVKAENQKYCKSPDRIQMSYASIHYRGFLSVIDFGPSLLTSFGFSLCSCLS